MCLRALIDIIAEGVVVVVRVPVRARGALDAEPGKSVAHAAHTVHPRDVRLLASGAGDTKRLVIVCYLALLKARAARFCSNVPDADEAWLALAAVVRG
jgi:hypothetical protein